MLFVRAKNHFEATSLQLADRIRVRPQQNRFCLWRPAPHEWIPDRIPIFRVRRATRIWVARSGGVPVQWLELPKGRGDALERVANLLGRDQVYVEGIRWVEEEPALALDQRFDYVAYVRGAA